MMSVSATFFSDIFNEHVTLCFFLRIRLPQTLIASATLPLSAALFSHVVVSCVVLDVQKVQKYDRLIN